MAIINGTFDIDLNGWIVSPPPPTPSWTWSNGIASLYNDSGNTGVLYQMTSSPFLILGDKPIIVANGWVAPDFYSVGASMRGTFEILVDSVVVESEDISATNWDFGAWKTFSRDLSLYKNQTAIFRFTAQSFNYGFFIYGGLDNVIIYDVQLQLSGIAAPAQISSEEASQITVHVTDSIGTSIENASVNLSATDGIVDPINGLTDTNGDFTSVYTAPVVTGVQIFTINIDTSKAGYSGASGSINITVNPLVPPPVQAGFGGIGIIFGTGLLIGLLFRKTCKDYDTKEKCEKAGCEWINGKCVEKKKR